MIPDPILLSPEPFPVSPDPSYILGFEPWAHIPCYDPAFYSAVSCWRLLLRCSRWIWSRRSRSRGVWVENLPGRGFGATCCACARHNSANANRWQTQFAQLLSQAHMLKINRDHSARLVSSNRESFAYTNSNTILLLYAGDISVPPRVPASGPEPCGGNNGKLNLFWAATSPFQRGFPHC